MTAGLPPEPVLDRLALRATSVVGETGKHAHRDADAYFHKWVELIRQEGYETPVAALEAALPGVTRRIATARDTALERREAAALTARMNELLEKARTLREDFYALSETGEPLAADDFDRIVGGIVAAVTEAERIHDAHSGRFTTVTLDGNPFLTDANREWIATMREIYASVRADRAEELRAARLAERAARRPADAVPADRRCVACGKKPARIDDLCKRCAHAAGTLPHGKIGAA